jgi:integrase
VEVGGGKIVVGDPKSDRSKRTVGLGPQLTALLKEHRKRQLLDRIAAADWAAEDPVLTDELGAMVCPWWLTKVFGQLARETGLEGSLHTLRHTAASVMLRSGQAPQVVADQLGHDVAVLLRIYAHIILEQRTSSAGVAEAFADEL